MLNDKTAIIFCRKFNGTEKQGFKSLVKQESDCRKLCEANWIKIVCVYKEFGSCMSKYTDVFTGAIKKFKDSNLKNAQVKNIDYFILNDKDSNWLDLYYVFTTLSNLIDIDRKKNKYTYIKLPDSYINLTVMPIEWVEEYYKTLNTEIWYSEFWF